MANALLCRRVDQRRRTENLQPQGWYGVLTTISGLSSDALFCLSTTVYGGDKTSKLWSLCPLARALAAPTLRCQGLPVGPPSPGLSGQQDSGWGTLALPRIDLAFEEDNSR